MPNPKLDAEIAAHLARRDQKLATLGGDAARGGKFAAYRLNMLAARCAEMFGKNFADVRAAIGERLAQRAARRRSTH